MHCGWTSLELAIIITTWVVGSDVAASAPATSTGLTTQRLRRCVRAATACERWEMRVSRGRWGPSLPHVFPRLALASGGPRSPSSLMAL
eukprot:2392776-Pyramimonas_sp.AAC.1